MGEGASLSEIIEESGTDVGTARTALIEALNELQFGDLDAEAIADRWLAPAEQ